MYLTIKIVLPFSLPPDLVTEKVHPLSEVPRSPSKPLSKAPPPSTCTHYSALVASCSIIIQNTESTFVSFDSAVRQLSPDTEMYKIMQYETECVEITVSCRMTGTLKEI